MRFYDGEHEVAWRQFELRAASHARGSPGRGLDELVDVLDGPHLQLWRAPTDNDGLPLIPDKDVGPLKRWLSLDLDVPHRKEVTPLDDGGWLFEHEVEVPEDLPRIGVVLHAGARAGAARVPRPRAVGELPRPAGLGRGRPLARAP